MARPRKNNTEEKVYKVPERKKVSKRKDLEYRLVDDKSPISVLLKVGKRNNLLVFDEEKGYNRPIKHCPNEKSIYVDEQSDFAIVEPIIFENGYFTAKANQPITQQFLNAHPSNVANGGTFFELVDESKEAEEFIEADELIVDLKMAVRNKLKEDGGITELEATVGSLKENLNKVMSMSPEELKRELYVMIDEDPYRFVDKDGKINLFNNNSLKLKYLVLRALKDGVIKKDLRGRTMLWSHNNEKIVTSPIGVSIVDYMADFLSTDEGSLIIEEITKNS